MSEADGLPTTLSMAEAASLLTQQSLDANEPAIEAEPVEQVEDSAPEMGAEPDAYETEDDVEATAETDDDVDAAEDGDETDVDPDELEDVFTVKVDGEEIELTPQQLIDAYQTRKRQISGSKRLLTCGRRLKRLRLPWKAAQSNTNRAWKPCSC